MPIKRVWLQEEKHGISADPCTLGALRLRVKDIRETASVYPIEYAGDESGVKG